MDVDNDIEVWLETDQNRGNLMTPYLQSKTPQVLEYRLRARKKGRSGRSEITQSGSVRLSRGKPTALGSIGMSVAQGDDCYIELSLVDGGALIASYILSCPEPVAQ